MATVTGPLHSDSASGSIADSITFGSWKGRATVRQKVDPSNPQTAKQTGIRAMMSFLSKAWAANTGTEWTGWTDKAKAGNYSTYNAYVGENLSRWQLGTGPTQAFPAAGVSVACAITTATLTGAKGFATALITPAANANIWGVAIFRDKVAITAAGWANCVGIVQRSDVTAFTFTDSPLDAGTYHYRFQAINKDGVLGAVLADATVIVT